MSALLLSVVLVAIVAVFVSVWYTRSENDSKFAERLSRAPITDKICIGIGFDRWKFDNGKIYCAKIITPGKQ